MVEFGIGGAIERGGVAGTGTSLVMVVSACRLRNACNFVFFLRSRCGGLNTVAFQLHTTKRSTPCTSTGPTSDHSQQGLQASLAARYA